jgi:hypothetical protein
VGRLGRLHAKHLPYQWLTTGCPSVVRNELVDMDGSTQTQLQNSSSVAYGVHCTLGSVLDETKDWLLAAEKHYDFADPKIGHMAKLSWKKARNLNNFTAYRISSLVVHT